MTDQTVYDYITTQENLYKTERLPLAENWHWNMHEHIERSFLLKHSKFFTGQNDDTRPNMNIVRPILNVHYRTEGFDVADIEPFVDDPDHYYKSFLFRRYHPTWARKNNIDEFLDSLVESYVDYGLALIKDKNSAAPEVVPLQRIAFCDQSDVLAGPLGERYEFSPEELRAYKGRWWDDEIENIINQAEYERQVNQSTSNQEVSTPGKHIEVYEVHGEMPAIWIPDYDGDEETVNQIQIVGFYKDKDGRKHGVQLFAGKEKPGRYDALKRDPIYGRACGFGAIEELFEPQMWVNYSMIQLKKMLDASAIQIALTDSPEFANQNKLNDMATGELKYIKGNAQLDSFQFNPANTQVFEENINRFLEHGNVMGNANESLQGEPPSSGTPFALQNLVVQEAKGTHKYRQGKIARFVGQLYRERIMGYLIDDMKDGQRFIDELDPDEMQQVTESLVRNRGNKRIKEVMLNESRAVTQEERQLFYQVARQNFLQKGKKHYMQVLKNELKDMPTDVEVNIKGKQADLYERVQKLTNIFRQIIANPEVLQQPGMSSLFNQILEGSGFSPLAYNELTNTLPLEQGRGEVPQPIPESEQKRLRAEEREENSRASN